MKSFWNTLKKPIIGLAPMDGVTDAAFRFIVDKYGKPDVLFTEFVPAEAIIRGKTNILRSFLHHKTKTKSVAQIFGSTPGAFYQAAFVAAEMGYDGIDINMGCPDKHVIIKGGGAGLIQNPPLAKTIIATVKKALRDWSEGCEIQNTGCSEEIIKFISSFKKQYDIFPKNKILPVSVKTRIGYNGIITSDWISSLLEAEPDAISLHGRTYKQLYSGKADWEEIGKAAELCSKTNTLLLGNGDVKSVSEAKIKAAEYNLAGVLIGRASLGNPWIFCGKIPTKRERFDCMVEHTEKFGQFRPDLKIFPMRKHFTWYCKGFDKSAKMRDNLMKINSLDELKKTLNV